MRTLVIGDVHGCLDQLCELIDRLGYVQGRDRLVSLGDLLDRGPDPVGCVQMVRLLGGEMVLGNHEEKALRWLAHEERRVATGKANPMKPSAKNTAQWAALPAADVAWLRSLPPVLDLGMGFVAVHGGLLPGVALDRQPMDRAIRLRWVNPNGSFAAMSPGSIDQPSGTRPWMEAWDGPQSVVVGHAVHSLDQPRVDRLSGGREVWSIDTGCVFGGRLSALVLDSDRPEAREVVQVQSPRAYSPLRGLDE